MSTTYTLTITTDETRLGPRLGDMAADLCDRLDAASYPARWSLTIDETEGATK